MSSYTASYSPVESVQTIVFNDNDETGQMSFSIGHSESLDVASTDFPWQTDINVMITAFYGPVS